MIAKGTGWVKDQPDDRDYNPETPAVAPIFKILRKVELPMTVDLRNFASPVEDQGNLGSCTAQAAAAAVELIQNKVVGKYIDMSRLFIYYVTRKKFEKSVGDSGATIRNTIKTLVKYGAPREKVWEYLIDRFDENPPENVWKEALDYQTLTYVSIYSINDIKKTLANGLPIQFGIYVFDSFYNTGEDGIVPIPNVRTEEFVGGHAILAVGYVTINAREYLICKNSWGPEWGDKGYFYLPMSYLTKTFDGETLGSDYWVILTQEFVDEVMPVPVDESKTLLEEVKKDLQGAIQKIDNFLQK